jgi:predicted dehydrogenase
MYFIVPRTNLASHCAFSFLTFSWEVKSRNMPLRILESVRERTLLFKVGLIGCGGISGAHLRVYELLRDDARVVAVCDTDLERARKVAARFNIGPAFDDHMELLENARPDFVDICTPTSTHARVVIDSTRSGCHVIVEKPMARSSDECRAMIHEAERNRVNLCVCHNNLFSPAVRNAKAAIDERKLTISSCHLKAKIPLRFAQRWLRKISEGGPLWEDGVHPLYVQRFLLGEISRVFAMSNKIKAESETDDNFNILLQSKSGSLGSVELSLCQNEGHEFNCQIECQNGYHIEADVPTDYLSIRRPTYNQGLIREWLGYSVEDLSRLSSMRLGYAQKYFASLTSSKWRFIRRTHLGLIERFVANLKGGLAPPVTGQEGLEAVRILEAAASSIETGKTSLL